MTKVNSVEELKEMLVGTEESPVDFCIANGMVRSSKSLMLTEEGKVNILNEIDDTEQTLAFEELGNQELTNIGVSIDRGIFFKY